jgi:hypothetical protein
MKLDVVAHHPHEVVALKPGSSFMGIFTRGRPAGLKLLSDERSGFTSKPVTIPLV